MISNIIRIEIRTNGKFQFRKIYLQDFIIFVNFIRKNFNIRPGR